jgi:hypothetical protein
MIMTTVKKQGGTKKVAAKKSAKSVQKVGLVCAEGDRCFWSNDGQIFSTLADLQNALRAISDETYAHHTSDGRNDYADWVEFVLLDKSCANSLRKAKGRKAAATVVSRALATYVV